ncbi:MAG: hypothetical protein N4J56_005763 [Chroococcidiopsis sp. SAG 2025]|uniref:hypothetical protein n=1 Tax=Chroococcidiopsis sp. SAG 2025 TaxID=171389 RepID=UPI0029372E1C|nr:hypothetical protein [Chroococcidiopsis sp. SAG 2025]MDV2996109.1 hypothetical protein [Chroococcidiopsis sp. SAG 2025]
MTEEEMKQMHEKIDTGVKAAIAAAIEKHRKLGESISIIQDGKVVTLTADEIPAIKLIHNNAKSINEEKS